MHIHIINNNPNIIKCFESAISAVSLLLPVNIKISIFNENLNQFLRHSHSPLNSAIVSPTNSMAFMGGGFDLAVASAATNDKTKIKNVASKIQNNVLSEISFLCPSLSAHVHLPSTLGPLFIKSPLYNRHVHNLILTSTMAVPEPIDPITIFYSMWNSLLLSKKLNLDELIVPALGAGYGGCSPDTTAQLMIGAVGLFYMEFPKLVSRAVAVEIFLNKDVSRFGNDPLVNDAINSTIDATASHDASFHTLPLPWNQLLHLLNTTK